MQAATPSEIAYCGRRRPSSGDISELPTDCLHGTTLTPPAPPPFPTYCPYNEVT